jgi:trans-aconitate methyltransferase
MSRTTVDDWKKIGDSEPFFGVLSAEKFLSANLTEEIIEQIYASGKRDIDFVVDILTATQGEFAPAVGLDVGCGVGRLTCPMASHCGRVIGLDVSPGMIAQARREVARRRLDNIVFAEGVDQLPRVDWINSYIVFQHIVPREGYALLAGLLDLLNPGGFLSVQITYAHDSRDRTILDKDVAAYRFDGETMTVLATASPVVGQMSMYDYDMNRVLFDLARRGLTRLTLHATDHGGAHGFWIFGRRDG